jgi:hypothetical protein
MCAEDSISILEHEQDNTEVAIFLHNPMTVYPYKPLTVRSDAPFEARTKTCILTQSGGSKLLRISSTTRLRLIPLIPLGREFVRFWCTKLPYEIKYQVLAFCLRSEVPLTEVHIGLTLNYYFQMGPYFHRLAQNVLYSENVFSLQQHEVDSNVKHLCLKVDILRYDWSFLQNLASGNNRLHGFINLQTLRVIVKWPSIHWTFPLFTQDNWEEYLTKCPSLKFPYRGKLDFVLDKVVYDVTQSVATEGQMKSMERILRQKLVFEHGNVPTITIPPAYTLYNLSQRVAV